MEKVFKRMLLTTLIICIFVASTLPLTVSSYDKVEDYPDFDPDIYAADMLTTENELAYTELMIRLNQESPTEILARNIRNNDELIGNMSAWKILTFSFDDENTGTYQKIKETDYYTTIILSALKLWTTSTFVQNNLDNSFEKSTKSLFDSFISELKIIYGADYVNFLSPDALKLIPANELYECFEKAFKETYKKIDKIDSAFEIFSNCVKYGKAFEQSINSTAAYFLCARMEDELKQVVSDLYNSCDSNANPQLKEALRKIKDASDSSIMAVQTAFYDFSDRIGTLIIGDFADKLFDSIVEMTPAIGLLIGQDTGKSLSNFLFNTDDIVEQNYNIIAFVEFETLVKNLTRQYIADYRNNPNQTNAKNLLSVIDVLFSNLDDSCNTAKSLYDKVWRENTYAFLLNCVDSSVGENYEAAVTAINHIKDDYALSYQFIHYNYYYDKLENEHPEIYDEIVWNGDYIPDDKIVQTGECGANGDNVKYTLLNNGLLIISGTGEMKNYVNYYESQRSPLYQRNDIKKIIIEQGITSIGREVFDQCTSLQEVTIPYSVKSINLGCFRNCINLFEITIPNSVTTIGGYAFLGCKSITNITIPNSITTLSYKAFYGCSGLTTIEIPRSITSINQGVFEECTSLKSVILPDSIKSISNDVFRGCTSLTSITIPNTVTAIGDQAFRNTALTSISIPYGITTIPGGLCQDCKSLITVNLPNTITSIGNSAFYGCSKLSSIHIPNSVKSIGGETFRYCTSLKTINLPEGLTSVGQAVFRDCSSLNNIVIPKSLTYLGSMMFSGCTHLNNIKMDHVTSVGDHAFSYCHALVDFGLPEGVKTVGYRAFLHCINLKSFTVPHTLSTIEQSTFFECENLEKIYIPSNVTTIKYVSSWPTFTNYNKQLTIFGEYGSTAETHAKNHGICFNEYISHFPEKKQTCTTDGKQKYYRNNFYEKYYEDLQCTIEIQDLDTWGIISATGHNYVTEIVNPTNFEQGYNVHTCLNCGDSYKDTYTDSLIEAIESGVCGKNVNYKLFANGTLIISGNGSMTNYTQNNSPFRGNNRIENIIIKEGVTSVGWNAFYECSCLENICIPNTVTYIGWYSFTKCTSLISIYIPDSVRTIGGNTFYHCSALKNIRLSNNLATIGSGAFSGCTSLIDINLPDSIESLDTSLFIDCINLQHVNIPSKIKSIEYHTFYNCTSLKSIDIPNSIISIGNGAFSGCKALEIIYIPDSVNSIGDEVFQNCDMLRDIIVDNNNLYFFSENGVLFNSEETQLIRYPASKNGSYTIKNGITTIKNGAFQSCHNLTTINIPDSMRTIGNYAFQYCDNLDNIIIPYGVESIGDGAFNCCDSLKNLSIPDSIISIGSSAFSGCNITSIHLPEKITSINSMTFSACKNLDRIYIPDSVAYIGSYAFFLCDNLKIYGKIGTYAQEYAINNYIPFFNAVSIVDKIPPYCVNSGKESYYHNNFNSKNFEDVDCTIEIQDIDSWGIILPTGHSWSPLTIYTWSNDNSTVTATHTCKNDVKHTETETVETVFETLIAPTYTEEGEGKYTATFTNIDFLVQTKNVVIPMLKRADISSAIIKLNMNSFDYDGTEKSVTYSVTLEGKTLVAGIDFTFEGDLTATDAGIYIIKIKGINAYKGESKTTWKIVPIEVTVKINGTPITQPYYYNKSLTVTAPVTESGSKFSHWEVNSKAVSYSATYSFIVKESVDLIPVYVTDEATVEQTAVLNVKTSKTKYNGKNAIKYTFTHSVPEGYTISEVGLLYATNKLAGANTTTSGYATMNLTNAEVATALGVTDVESTVKNNTSGKVKKYVASYKKNNGTVTFSYAIGTNTTAYTYAIGYIKVVNKKTGESETLYSNFIATNYNNA